MPQSGWSSIGQDDLGDLCGECELCGTHFRYAFAVIHPKWGSMVVGIDCCDRLTASDEASQFMEQLAKRRSKLARFIESKRWKACEDGATTLAQWDSIFVVLRSGAIFTLVVNGQSGHRQFGSLVKARRHLFETIESGAMTSFITRQREKRRKARNSAFFSAQRHCGALAP